MDTTSILRIEAEPDNLEEIRRFVQETLTAFDVDPTTATDMLLAVDEAATNIIVHGYQGQPGLIEVELKRGQESLVACLRDQAPPFDPTSVLPPDVSVPLELRRPGGMGIHLIRQLMDQVTYRFTPQGENELTLVKKRSI